MKTKTMTDLNSIAKWAFDQSPDDWKRAIDVARRYLAQHPRVRTSIANRLITEALADVIGLYGRQRRSEIWERQHPVPIQALRPLAKASPAIRAAIQREAETLLDFPLMNGKRLGDATFAEVTIAANHYMKQGAENLRRGHFLTAILKYAESEKLPDTAKVKNHLSAPQLESLRARARVVA